MAFQARLYSSLAAARARLREQSGLVLSFSRRNVEISLFAAACLYFFWCTHVPSTGKAVLLIGVVAVLMTITDLRTPLKVASLTLVFALAFLENKSIGQDRIRAQTDRDAAFSIAGRTASTVNQTLTTVILLGNRMDNYRDEAQKANNNHETQLLAHLQAEKEATQKRILLSLSPGSAWRNGVLGKQMGSRRQGHRREIEVQTNNLPRTTPPQELDRALEPVYKKRTNLNIIYTRQVLPTMTNAYSLRSRLLGGSPQTPDDKKSVVIFDKALAGEPIRWSDMRDVTAYMNDFIKRFTPA